MFTWNAKKILILSLMFVVLIPACSGYSDQVRTAPIGLSDYAETSYYSINPKTILEELDRGATDVFTPVMATPESYELGYSSPFQWEQSDYLKIAEALHYYVWKETLADWSLYNMSFYGSCRFDPVGFDLFRITYFKLVGSQQYATREIDIYPLYDGAAAGGEAAFPKPLLGWKSIELDKIKITANNALRIAEENGGRTARLTVNNDCTIYVALSSSDQNWTVSYSDQGSSFIFEMIIDPYTGTYKILE